MQASRLKAQDDRRGSQRCACIDCTCGTLRCLALSGPDAEIGTATSTSQRTLLYKICFLSLRASIRLCPRSGFCVMLDSDMFVHGRAGRHAMPCSDSHRHDDCCDSLRQHSNRTNCYAGPGHKPAGRRMRREPRPWQKWHFGRYQSRQPSELFRGRLRRR